MVPNLKHYRLKWEAQAQAIIESESEDENVSEE